MGETWGSRSIPGDKVRWANRRTFSMPDLSHIFGGKTVDERVETDTDKATMDHIELVRSLIGEFSIALLGRGQVHDQSKLESPEREEFAKYVPRLKGMTYGSEEYKECCRELGPALQHYYENNSHHPEHFEDGVSGMNLLDVVEMFLDWYAATKRNDDGDIRRSIDQNAERFNLDPMLVRIFQNSVEMVEGFE